MKNKAEDFLGRFTVVGGCWVWNHRKDTSGYGKFKFNGKDYGAHRFAYELLVGPIPPDLELDHLCRNRACVNPDHLEAVVHRENCKRGMGGLVNTLRQRSKTHCPYGHEYTNNNTILRQNRRSCRTCTYARNQYYQSHRGVDDDE